MKADSWNEVPWITEIWSQVPSLPSTSLWPTCSDFGSQIGAPLPIHILQWVHLSRSCGEKSPDQQVLGEKYSPLPACFLKSVLQVETSPLEMGNQGLTPRVKALLSRVDIDVKYIHTLVVQWLGVEPQEVDFCVSVPLYNAGGSEEICAWGGCGNSFMRPFCVSVFKYRFSVCNFLYWFIIGNSFHVCCTRNSSVYQWLIWLFSTKSQPGLKIHLCIELRERFVNVGNFFPSWEIFIFFLWLSLLYIIIPNRLRLRKKLRKNMKAFFRQKMSFKVCCFSSYYHTVCSHTAAGSPASVNNVIRSNRLIHFHSLNSGTV